MTFYYTECHSDDYYLVEYHAVKTGTHGPRIITPSTSWMIVYLVTNEDFD